MDGFLRFHSAYGGKSGFNVRKKITMEPPIVAFSGESRYLTALWVSGKEEQSADSSKSPTYGFKLGADRKYLHDKIKAALKLLSLRERRVIIQFWWPLDYGKHKLLTTADQPFGVGAIDEAGVIDEGLRSYRINSVDNPVLVVKNLDDEERDQISPLARVFSRGFPEWTCDITNYSPTHFPQQDCAIRCNFHGYIALPVFDSTAGLCVGVLELLTSSKYISYAFEVQQIHKALKKVDLTSPQAIDCPALDVHNEHKQNELGKIFRILKEVCGIHKLPLAQTWAVSLSSSFACHEQILEKTCNSFDSRCLKKVCMSTSALPFYLEDSSMWHFRKACRGQHLDRSHSFVGKVLLSRSSCFCGDVTKLGEDEYPLVYKARMSRLTSCFAIFLHSIQDNNDYVLEFFLPLGMEDGRSLPNLLLTLKENIEIVSGFELGNISCIRPPPTDVSCLSFNRHPHTIQISSNATSKSNILEVISLDSESMVTSVTKTEPANVPKKLSFEQNDSNDYSDIITATENLNAASFRGNINARENENTSYASLQEKSSMIIDAGDKRNHLKQGRKRKIDSLGMEEVQQHLEKPIYEAAKSLNVSQSTLKRFCREHEMRSWPLPKHNKKAATVTNLKLPQRSGSEQQLHQPTNVLSSMHVVVFLLIRVKRWSCSGKRHEFSGRWWSCGKHKYLPAKSDYIYQVARLMVQLRRWRYNISTRHALQKRDHIAVSESISKPKYTTNITNPYSYYDWQLSEPILLHASPKQHGADYIYRVARLMVLLRRWRNKTSTWHPLQKRDQPAVSESTSTPKHTTNNTNLNSHFDWQLPEPILVHASLKQKGADCLYRVAHLMVLLKRWRNKISKRHALQKRDHPAVSECTSNTKYTTNITKPYLHFDSQLPGPILVHASLKQNVSDIRMVTVKASYKDDMIKFQFPTSSGLSELEKEVAQRINLKSRRFHLKYTDEDNDLILLACDADLRNLLRFSTSNGTFKFFVAMVDD